MNAQVLVTYASKYGATAKIAEQIGKILQQEGLSFEILPVDQVRNIIPYQAIVMGSAVYMGQWRRNASKFLKSHAGILAQKPVWLFSSGPTGEGDPETLLKGWKLPAGLQSIADHIRPKDIAVFGGVLKPEKMNFFEKWIIRKVKAPVGDFCNWDAVAKWAKRIGQELKAAAPSPK